MKYIGWVVALSCLALGLMGQSPSHAQSALGLKSPVLPSSREAIFVLSVAELRVALLRYEQFLPLPDNAAPCAGCEDMAPEDEAMEAEFEAQREEQRALKVEIEEMIRNVKDLRAEIQDIVAEAQVRTEEEESDKKGKKKPAAKQSAKEGSTEQTAAEEEQSELAQKTYYERLIEKKLDPKFKQIRNLQQRMYRKVSAVDDKGYTWIARGVIADNSDFVSFLRRMGGSDGLLQTELVQLARTGDTKDFKSIMDLGADVYHEPGSYSALSFAKLFGYKEIATSLIKNGATVQAPWDPHRSEDREALTKMTKAQTRRVKAFASTLGPSAQNDPQVAYFKKLLDKLVCRSECLAKKSKEIKMAEYSNIPTN